MASSRQKLLRLDEEDRIPVPELGEKPVSACPANNDARLAVARQHDAHAPRLEVERGRVPTPCERVPEQHHLVLAALDLVRRGPDERVRIDAELAQSKPHPMDLVVVSGHDRDVLGLELPHGRIELLDGVAAAFQQSLHQRGQLRCDLGVGPDGQLLRRLDIRPTVLGAEVEYVVLTAPGSRPQ